jgi:uncharacterized protein (TIGR03067 family)
MKTLLTLLSCVTVSALAVADRLNAQPPKSAASKHETDVGKKELAALAGRWRRVEFNAVGVGWRAAEYLLHGGKKRNLGINKPYPMEIKGNIFIFAGTAAGKAIVEIDPTKSSKTIDLTDAKGRTWPGIYEWKGDELIIDLGLGKKRPATIKRSGTFGQANIVYKRAKNTPGEEDDREPSRPAKTRGDEPDYRDVLKDRPPNAASSVAPHSRKQPAKPAWGRAVAGVQVRLRTGIHSWRLGESPAFLADVRNTEKATLVIAPTQELCEVECDGVVCRWAHDPRNDESAPLPPGRTVTGIPLVLTSDWKSSKGKPLNLTAGKHRVRVTFFAESAKEMEGKSKPIRATSNTIAIETTDKRMAPGTRDRGIDQRWVVQRLFPARFWSDRPTARNTDAPIQIRAKKQAVQGKKIALSLTITNRSKSPIQARLPHEWHGGLWPPTDLYASVTPVGSRRLHMFHEVFLLDENPSLATPRTIKAGESLDLTVRMDWPGTGSVRTQPLMDAKLGREYDVRFLLTFRRNGKIEYVAGPATRVKITRVGTRTEH